MKHNKLSLFFLFSAFACCTTATSSGMIQEEQLTPDVAAIADTNAVNDIPEAADVKLTNDLDKLISLLQKASEPTRENKIAAACTAIGIGSMTAFLTGSLYRLYQNKPVINGRGYCIKSCRCGIFRPTLRSQVFGQADRVWREEIPWPCNCGYFKMDVSDFARATALVGIPIGLLTAGLSFLALNKIIQQKDSSELNTFAEKLNTFKAALSNNEPLSQDNQIKLDKIITLALAIFEKNNSTSTTAILKKIALILGGATTFSFLSTASYDDLLTDLYQSNITVENNIDSLEKDRSKLLLIQTLASLLSGAGFTWLVTNKLSESESLNMDALQEAIVHKLYDFLPSEPLAG